MFDVVFRGVYVVAVDGPGDGAFDVSVLVPVASLDGDRLLFGSVFLTDAETADEAAVGVEDRDVVAGIAGADVRAIAVPDVTRERLFVGTAGAARGLSAAARLSAGSGAAAARLPAAAAHSTTKRRPRCTITSCGR
ncbi:MAG: hypothetical protein BGP24_05675 [Lysobacterales bacterium 69-70]|nr:hypothetical protein [Xanthomonadaceae bacterium]ODU34851.1 MAG: hypothetical protein ABS97_06660 [Xanthomonadaceae bacterium SCN 69-320]ODV19742.1 MAG: hypothetical protein ABT27_10020 [Xanthomonadaceae bacterium SCN 69-25]OJY95103.1 MAG: hypothetical protein BGP24_05675 [Xanthomonadales bacterium 69-70]